MKLSHKLIMVSTAVLMGASPILTAAQTQTAQAATKKTNKKVAKKSSKKSSSSKATKKTTSKSNTTTSEIVFGKNAYVYDQNGKRNKNYKVEGKVWPVIGKGAKVNAYGTKTIDGQLYYFIGNNSYVKAANIATVDGKKVTTKAAKNKTDNTKTITLTHDAYVYDVNGKRITKAGVLKKSASITYVGTKNIKGKKYYNLGKDQYVKTNNAKKAASTNSSKKDTYIQLVKNSIVYDEDGNPYSPALKFLKGAGYQAYAAKKIDGKWFYQIGTDPQDTQWIKAVNAYVTNGPALIDDPDFVEPKPSTSDDNSTIVTLKNDAQVYNNKGAAVPNNTFYAGYSLRVNKLLWIWVPTENQAVEFYGIAADTSSYIKVSDISTISGVNLVASNTAEDAKAAGTVANDSDKVALKSLLDNAETVKNSDAYKLATTDAKSAYDTAITKGQSINSSPTASVLDVNQAADAINKAISGL